MKSVAVVLGTVVVLGAAAFVLHHVHRGTWGEQVSREEIAALRAEHDEVLAGLAALPEEASFDRTVGEMNAHLAEMLLDEMDRLIEEGNHREALERRARVKEALRHARYDLATAEERLGRP